METFKLGLHPVNIYVIIFVSIELLTALVLYCICDYWHDYIVSSEGTINTSFGTSRPSYTCTAFPSNRVVDTQV